MEAFSVGNLSIGRDAPPRVMGVLNVSVESPYDPSVFADSAAAAEYVQSDLLDPGADIVDIGLASANKRLDVLSVEEELERLPTAIETIEAVDTPAIFSIETRYHEVAERALAAGFNMVNDVCGFADPEMPVVCDRHDAPVVKMASPPDLTAPGAVLDHDWGKDVGDDIVEALFAGLERGGWAEKTIVDPAFGGWSEQKTIEDDQTTFDRLNEFRAFDRPMLVSINRKNFLGKLVDRPTEERLPASLAATSMAVARGADIIRTHDVAETVDAVTIGAAFSESPATAIETSAGTVTRRAFDSGGESRRWFDRRNLEELATIAPTVTYLITAPTAIREICSLVGRRYGCRVNNTEDVLYLTGDERTVTNVSACLTAYIDNSSESIDVAAIGSALRSLSRRESLLRH